MEHSTAAAERCRDEAPEQWKPIPGYEGLYEVSDHGSIRTKRRKGSPGGLMRTPINRNGYPEVNLTLLGRQRVFQVHSLIMLTFVGPRPDGLVVRHLNGDSTDCRLSNLAYGTPSKNNYDLVEHGTHHHARKTHCPAGHPYDAENTYVLPSRPRARYCKACNRAQQSARKKAKRVALRAERERMAGKFA